MGALALAAKVSHVPSLMMSEVEGSPLRSAREGAVCALRELGRDYLAQGLIPEAEQEFQAAIAADPSSAEAHAGRTDRPTAEASPSDKRIERDA